MTVPSHVFGEFSTVTAYFFHFCIEEKSVGNSSAFPLEVGL